MSLTVHSVVYFFLIDYYVFILQFFILRQRCPYVLYCWVQTHNHTGKSDLGVHIYYFCTKSTDFPHLLVWQQRSLIVWNITCWCWELTSRVCMFNDWITGVVCETNDTVLYTAVDTDCRWSSGHQCGLKRAEFKTSYYRPSTEATSRQAAAYSAWCNAVPCCH